MKRFLEVSNCEVTYYDDVQNDFEEFINGIDRTTRRKQKIDYYNIPCCFDIETSSFYDNGQKAGCMYIWMFSIDDHIIIGRTWEEFILLLKLLSEKLSLHVKFRRLVCYIQNLGYEFQWFCHRIRWEKVFATDERAPLTALTENGIEFRCSYRLSGYNLQKMGENLTKYNVQKMVGDLDYKKIRHSGTPLTDKEMGYCINDVRVLSAYIREKIEQDGGITKIPLTKTGYVRLYCREHIFGGRSHRHDYKVYHAFMQQLTLDPEEFEMLLRAFQGGFTHASTFYSNEEEPLEGVTSFDVCSMYPSEIYGHNEFPMNKGEFYEPKDSKDLKYQLSHYACVFDVRFIGLKPKILYDNYISESKCIRLINPVINNGRVVSADDLIITITNIDLDVIKVAYKWDNIEIGRFIRYEKGYLPKEFVDCVLDFYENKTLLKSVEGFEAELMYFKELLNACYGCMVTNPCKELVTFDKEWTSDSKKLKELKHKYKKDPAPDLEKEIQLLTKKIEKDKLDLIDKYNKKKDRFLFYPWGVFVTALARRDIWLHGIIKAGPDYVYCDTDSVKFIGNHAGFEKEFNKIVLKRMLRACRYHGIELSRIMPKTKDGKVKPLGVFEFDGHGTFKTLGAKRYLMKYSQDPRNGKKRGKLIATVAGLNKKKGSEYIGSFVDPFKVFSDNMTVPKEYSGRQAATYIDEPIKGTVTDYQGNTAPYCELSCLHLEETEYNLDIKDDYLNYLLGIQEREDI